MPKALCCTREGRKSVDTRNVQLQKQVFYAGSSVSRYELSACDNKPHYLLSHVPRNMKNAPTTLKADPSRRRSLLLFSLFSLFSLRSRSLSLSFL